ncbi:MAG: hypothetical protein HRT45_15925 [Bdellovibrionales bacterium]|nr:hypothetical protein [Bdellovibrionales bacterium]
MPFSMSQTEELLNKVDKMIRLGHVEDAWQLIKDVKPADLPRKSLSELSNIARRARRPLHSLKILGKIIKQHRDNLGEASSSEIVSYVGSLIKLGFFNEAERWLTQVDPKSNPEVHDLKARIHIAHWNYSSAAFYLKKYLNNVEPSSYFYQVGSLNLASSYLSMNLKDRALVTVKGIQKYAREHDNKLLLANSYELQAQSQIQLGKYKGARASLKKSQSLLGTSGNIWSFYGRKWDLVIDLETKMNRQSASVLKKAEDLYREGISKHYWEGAREIDRLLANARSDRNRALKVYFGTPYAEYKKMVKTNFPGGLTVPRSFKFKSEGATKKSLFDFENRLARSLSSKNLFVTLTKDLYRPLSLGYVFESLYEESFFDPFHTPDRIYSTVKRLRALLPEESGIGVDWSQSGVTLKFDKPVALDLSLAQPKTDIQVNRATKVRQHFKQDWFTSKQVREFLNASEATTQRCLKEAQSQYKLERAGHGRSTRYRFK